MGASCSSAAEWELWVKSGEVSFLCVDGAGDECAMLLLNRGVLGAEETVVSAEEVAGLLGDGEEIGGGALTREMGGDAERGGVLTRENGGDAVWEAGEPRARGVGALLRCGAALLLELRASAEGPGTSLLLPLRGRGD